MSIRSIVSGSAVGMIALLVCLSGCSRNSLLAWDTESGSDGDSDSDNDADADSDADSDSDSDADSDSDSDADSDSDSDADSDSDSDADSDSDSDVDICTAAATLVCDGSDYTSSSASGSSILDDYDGCGVSNETGYEYVYSFTPESDGEVTIDMYGGYSTGNIDLFLLEGACNPNDCIEASNGSNSNGTIEASVNAGTEYFIVVDGYGGVSGDFGITMSCHDDPGLLRLSFWEKIMEYSYNYHRVLVGPSSSTNPTDGSWEVVADEDDMYNDTWSGGATNTAWSMGYVLDLSDWTGEAVRIAFQYYGVAYDDKWYIDDLCLGVDADGSGQPDTCFYQESFETPGYPSLPMGWDVHNGPDHSAATDWRTSLDNYHTGLTSALREYPEAGEVGDTYLVSAPIALP